MKTKYVGKHRAKYRSTDATNTFQLIEGGHLFDSKLLCK